MYTIYPLAVGFNETDQGIMTYQRFYGKRIILPIYVFAIKGGEKKILVDTGLEDFMAPSDLEERIGFPVMDFEEALETVGWKPDEVDIIVHTHLHNDHCENDSLCTNADIYVQQAELDFCLNPHPIDHRYYPEILEGLNIKTVKGDAKIVDGIDVLFTPGHTPGGQSVVVETSMGKAIITGLCCNSENFPSGGGVIAPGVHIDAIQAYESMIRIRESADILIPIHDLEIGRKKSIPS
ncbi:MAG: N-acyl homoserine lactonase family protein [Deltaproteobacteria bacterium]|nr:N-acyl homoserine lactonase family protein [Deltaproteobacteria bacterium]